jgi:hypothetical protein
MKCLVIVNNFIHLYWQIGNILPLAIYNTTDMAKTEQIVFKQTAIAQRID